jgi:hypothetical protein
MDAVLVDRTLRSASGSLHSCHPERALPVRDMLSPRTNNHPSKRGLSGAPCSLFSFPRKALLSDRERLGARGSARCCIVNGHCCRTSCLKVRCRNHCGKLAGTFESHWQHRHLATVGSPLNLRSPRYEVRAIDGQGQIGCSPSFRGFRVE